MITSKSSFVCLLFLIPNPDLNESYCLKYEPWRPVAFAVVFEISHKVVRMRAVLYWRCNGAPNISQYIEAAVRLAADKCGYLKVSAMGTNCQSTRLSQNCYSTRLALTTPHIT